MIRSSALWDISKTLPDESTCNQCFDEKIYFKNCLRMFSAMSRNQASEQSTILVESCPGRLISLDDLEWPARSPNF